MSLPSPCPLPCDYFSFVWNIQSNVPLGTKECIWSKALSLSWFISSHWKYLEVHCVGDYQKKLTLTSRNFLYYIFSMCLLFFSTSEGISLNLKFLLHLCKCHATLCCFYNKPDYWNDWCCLSIARTISNILNSIFRTPCTNISMSGV